MIWWIRLPVTSLPIFLLVFTFSRPLLARIYPRYLAVYTAAVFGLIWGCALALFGLVLLNGPQQLSLVNIELNSVQVSLFGFLADRLSMVMLLLVTTVSGVVHLYSLRSMVEELHFTRYFTLLSLVTLEVLLVVLANNLLMLGVFWILKGFTLTFLLSHYQTRAASWRAAFKKLRIDLIGASAFGLAIIVTWKIFGTFELQTINKIATSAPQSLPLFQTTLLTGLLFVAMMAKSAQFPLHGWLPQSVEAPTPVSALMHAGLINAGGFLFIRLSPLFLTTPVTMWLAVVIGGFTAFYGTLIMLSRNDVKGMLVYSTMGQMGFMMLECGLGAFGLATLHLVAHGLFKANLFLSAGSVIQQKTARQLIAPLAGHGSAWGRVELLRLGLISSLAALLFLGLPGVFGFEINTGSVLLAFAWITLAYALTEVARLPLYLLLPGVVVFVSLYLVIIHAVESFFQPVVAPAPVIESVWLLGAAVILALLGFVSLLVQNSGKPSWLSQFFRGLYVRVLFTGYGQ